MRNLLKFLNRTVPGHTIVLIVGLALLWAPALTLYAQGLSHWDKLGQGTIIASSIADDADVALIVKYVGTAASGTVTVAAATGDITFKSGASGSEAADTSLECPVSGALGGIIDVSDAACDTMGEVVDIINNSVLSGRRHWVAVLLDGRRSNISTDTLATLAETAATGPNGLNVVWDTDVALHIGRAQTGLRTIQPYLEGPPTAVNLRDNPFKGLQTWVFHANTVSTYATGTSTFQCFSILATNSGTTEAGAETVSTIFTQANGATTVSKAFDTAIFGYLGIPGKRDEKVYCEISNSTALASATLYTQSIEIAY